MKSKVTKDQLIRAKIIWDKNQYNVRGWLIINSPFIYDYAFFHFDSFEGIFENRSEQHKKMVSDSARSYITKSMIECNWCDEFLKNAKTFVPEKTNSFFNLNYSKILNKANER